MATAPAKTPAPAASDTPAREPLVLTNVRASIVRIAGLTFAPFQKHTIPEQHEAGVRKSALFGTVLREGQITPPPAAVISKPASLAEVEEAKALAYIGVETDLQVLSTWALEESAGTKRSVITDAISERATKIAKG